MRTMTVNEAARRLRRSARWLRESEAKGKIPTAKRDLNGWRVYTSEDIKTIQALIVPGEDDNTTE